jgi:hypothetical protein
VKYNHLWLPEIELFHSMIKNTIPPASLCSLTNSRKSKTSIHQVITTEKRRSYMSTHIMVAKRSQVSAWSCGRQKDWLLIAHKLKTTKLSKEVEQ